MTGECWQFRIECWKRGSKTTKKKIIQNAFVWILGFSNLCNVSRETFIQLGGRCAIPGRILETQKVKFQYYATWFLVILWTCRSERMAIERHVSISWDLCVVPGKRLPRIDWVESLRAPYHYRCLSARYSEHCPSSSSSLHSSQSCWECVCVYYHGIPAWSARTVFLRRHLGLLASVRSSSICAVLILLPRLLVFILTLIAVDSVFRTCFVSSPPAAIEFILQVCIYIYTKWDISGWCKCSLHRKWERLLEPMSRDGNTGCHQAHYSFT